MAYQVAIIGSFQKYYSEILDIIKEFKQAGFCVCSPKESFISNRIEDFVIFKADDHTQTPAEIQMVTLEKIMCADAVYVYNPNGYVGKTTCYEIGFCFSRRKPLYFFASPNDLPIPWDQKLQVVSPVKFIDLISKKQQQFIIEYKFCSEAAQAFQRLFDLDSGSGKEQEKRIVICGSMQFYDEMVACQKELAKLGIKSIVPKDENNIINIYSEAQFMDFKRRVSNSYLRKIRDKYTVGVLIYNAEKRGIKNYIGANTLVELAMAFIWNRQIFIYNDLYDVLKDELLAWGCICLHGELIRIQNYLSTVESITISQDNQLTFFN